MNTYNIILLQIRSILTTAIDKMTFRGGKKETYIKFRNGGLIPWREDIVLLQFW